MTLPMNVEQDHVTSFTRKRNSGPVGKAVSRAVTACHSATSVIRREAAVGESVMKDGFRCKVGFQAWEKFFRSPLAIRSVASH
ncbi:hypothetical protein M4R22_05945 [Acidovorax sp. GBBC 3334]|uniref:hypothetical protein n=1 Tax=Acidovorax sp. GBBC 3334 TaxID=2940496 RepID=UPI00230441B0|nr:hypothetical protein [Acidovorax sp. GBBC 3334]MDA8454298.1 hypothetical protein [Acidovorax sp. GBBC 3334]